MASHLSRHELANEETQSLDGEMMAEEYSSSNSGAPTNILNFEASNEEHGQDDYSNPSNSHPQQTKDSKFDTMPTWAATNSLILTAEGHIPIKFNSEVMAPLLLRSPTDYSTLYTALKLTQDVSAYVCGAERRTIITLDMDLFERAMKVKSHFPSKTDYCVQVNYTTPLLLSILIKIIPKNRKKSN